MSVRDSTSLSITHLTAPGAFGGLESVVSLLAKVGGERGHRVRIVALHGLNPAERCGPFQDLPDIELTEVRLPPRSYRREVRRLSEILDEVPGTVVHTHGYHADMVGLFAARRSGCPVVSTVHGFTAGDLKNRIYEWLDRRALARFDAVIAVSKPLQGLLARQGVPQARIHLVPNAWANLPPVARDQARRHLGLPPTGLVVGWVGRLAEVKGPDLLVAAIPSLPEGVGISVVGNGEMRARLDRQLSSLGVGGRITWHGAVEQAGRYLSAFDVLALSSRSEGTPIVLLEAMAARVPIVATAVGGVPDVVSPAEAELVPPDDPVALAAAITRALDPAIATARVEAAQRRLDHEFDPGRWYDRHEAIYRSIGS